MDSSPAGSRIRLVVGLGNPGPEYAATRHNLGFEVLEELARSENTAWSVKTSLGSALAKVSAESEGAVAPHAVHLAKPLTFMNRSGEAVSALAAYFKVRPEEILVVCDDCDLPIGELRLRPDGGPGTHNGLRSIVEHLRSEDFARLRLGVGQPPRGLDWSDHVLGEFGENEKPAIHDLTRRAVLAIKASFSAPLEKVMNEFNGRQSA